MGIGRGGEGRLMNFSPQERRLAMNEEVLE
jgi:hypothetical protein